MEIVALQECLNRKNSRIRNYIRSIISSQKKEAEKLYNNTFNPFYKWKVGRLSENEIKDVLIYYATKNETNPKVINYGDETISEYSILLKSFESLLKGENAAKLTHENWLSIRENYEIESKKERKKNFEISFKDSFAPKFFNEESDDLDFIIEDIGYILDSIHLGNWSITIVSEVIAEFNYRLIIINEYIDSDIKEVIINMSINEINKYFLKNYEKSEFAVKKIKKNYFIDGHFQYNKEC